VSNRQVDDRVKRSLQNACFPEARVAASVLG
jgi:hypothetical protein